MTHARGTLVWRPIVLTTMLLLAGITYLPSPASATEWTKRDMGKPYDDVVINGMTGVALGDGDRDGRTEVYLSCADNNHVYMFRLENDKWTAEDLGALKNKVLYGTYDFSLNGIILGDADNDGQDEIYASCNNDTDHYWETENHVFQLVNGSGGWMKTELGVAGWVGSDMALGDGNRDGKNELFCSDLNGHIYELSNQSGSWDVQDIGSPPEVYVTIPNLVPPRSFWMTPQVYAIAVGDGDNDGRTEVYAGAGDNHVYMFDHNGSAWNRTDLGAGEPTSYLIHSWWGGPGGFYAPLDGIQALAVGDADNDGANEVYGASVINTTIWRYGWDAGQGAWNLTKLCYLDSSSPRDLVVGDVDTDGRNELCEADGNFNIYAVGISSDGSCKVSSIGAGKASMNSVAVGSLTADNPMNEIFGASGDGHGYEFYTDPVPPANPEVWSDTHPTTGIWYNNSTVHVLWRDRGFDRTGIDGYSVLWDGNPTTVPDDTKDAEETVHELSTTLEDGDWYFHIRSRDNALNWNRSATHFGPIRIDTTPPGFINMTINGGAEYTNSKLVSLAISATDSSPGSGLARMALSNDGLRWSDWEPYSVSRSGWDLTDNATGGEDSDGMKSVHLRVMDNVGNELPAAERSNDSIFLDRVAPDGLSVVINDDDEFATGADVVLALEAQDPEPASGLSKMALSNDGAAWSDWTDWNGMARWSLVTGAGGLDADGARTVHFRVLDRAGNIADSVNDNIFLDRNAPGNLSVIINGGAAFTNTSVVELAILADDPNPGSELSEMALANDASGLGTWEAFATSRTGWSLVFGAGGSDTDGNKEVALEVRDRAKNTAGPVKDAIFLDRVSPGQLEISINGGATYATSPDVDLTLNASDAEPSSGMLMQVSGDGVAWTDWEPFSVHKDFTLPAPDGTRTVRFRVKDRAGNIADAVSASIILDTAPPVILSVRVVDITDNSARVVWSTDEEADSLVDFGLSSAYGSTRLDIAFVSSHSIALGPLAAGTVYHFRVQSKDRAGNAPTVTGDYVFITPAAHDNTPPDISNLRVSGITDRLAVASWTTNEPADSLAEYGTDQALGLKASDAGNFVLKHSLILSGLSPSTTYYVRAASTDTSGNGPSKSQVLAFTTAGTPDTWPPLISNVRVIGMTDRRAVIFWETDEPADGAVEYGASADYGYTITQPNLAMLHEVSLAGLRPSTTYHFRARSSDATGNGPSISGDFSFTTAATPDIWPPSILNLRVDWVTANMAFVLWETSEMADAFVEYGPTADYGHSSSVSEFSLLHSLLLQGLLPGTVYHLRVRSADPGGNLGESGDIAFRTKKTAGAPDTTPPVISGVSVLGVTDTRAVVLWATNELADSLVEYGATTAYGLRASDPAYSLAHSILLDGLSPSTVYHLRVKATDISGNGPVRSEDIVFVTGAAPDRTPPRIFGVKCSNITNTSVVITWSTDEPATGLVDYGASIHYDRNLTSRIYVVNHTIMITGLSPSTTYHFRVLSVDPTGNAAQPGEDRTFTTLKSYKPPTARPGEPAIGWFPWVWIGLAAVAILLVAGLVLARRRTARKDERAASSAKDEETETLAMDEPGPPGPGPLWFILCPSCRADMPVFQENTRRVQCPSCGRSWIYKGPGEPGSR